MRLKIVHASSDLCLANQNATIYRLYGSEGMTTKSQNPDFRSLTYGISCLTPQRCVSILTSKYI